MSSYVAYSEPLKYKYKASFWSHSTVFLLVNGIFTFILPFIISYNTGNGIWLKYETERTFPIVKFKYKYLLLLEINDKFRSTYICTTYEKFKNLREEDHCPLVIVEEQDINKDGKNEKINLQFYAANLTSIGSFTLILIFDYKLAERCILHTDTMVIISETFIRPVNSLNIIADLLAIQKKPLDCYTRPMNNNSIDVMLSSNSVQLKEILNDYASKEFSTKLTNLHTSVTYGSIKQAPVIISATISIREHDIVFKSRFWQLIKWAWVQYFSLLGLFMLISRKIKSFMFKNRILQTKCVTVH